MKRFNEQIEKIRWQLKISTNGIISTRQQVILLIIFCLFLVAVFIFFIVFKTNPEINKAPDFYVPAEGISEIAL